MTVGRLKVTGMVGLTAMLAIAISGCGAEPAADLDGSTAAAASHRAVSLDWETDWDRAFSRAGSEGKAVLASFNADWCVWCRRLETTTFRDAQVTALLGARTVPLTLDVDGNGRKLSDDLDVDGLPTVVLFAADGRELGRIDGYVAPDGFLELVTGILARS